jgi:hypothetical protein
MDEKEFDRFMLAVMIQLRKLWDAHGGRPLTTKQRVSLEVHVGDALCEFVCEHALLTQESEGGQHGRQ